MNCPECHDQIQRHLDGAAGPDPAVLEPHLASCPDCRERHRAAQRLAEGLRLLSPPVPPASLSGRIVACVQARHAAGVRFRRRVRLAAAAAAGLLLAVFAGYEGRRLGLFGGREEQARLAQGPGRPLPGNGEQRANLQPLAPAPSLDQTFTEAGSAAVALTRQTADKTVARARRWLPPAAPMADLQSGDPVTPVWQPLVQVFRQAGHSVSKGFQPVADSGLGALDVFKGILAPSDTAEKSGS